LHRTMSWFEKFIAEEFGSERSIRFLLRWQINFYSLE